MCLLRKNMRMKMFIVSRVLSKIRRDKGKNKTTYEVNLTKILSHDAVNVEKIREKREFCNEILGGFDCLSQKVL